VRLTPQFLRALHLELFTKPSFRRKPESSNFKKFWTPAFAGVTLGAPFYETIKYCLKTLNQMTGAEILTPGRQAT
jgi:hypothetical protein